MAEDININVNDPYYRELFIHSVNDALINTDFCSTMSLNKIVKLAIHAYDRFTEGVAEDQATKTVTTKSGKNTEEDTRRLDWIELHAKKSSTGISLQYIPSIDGEASGYRFIRKGWIGTVFKTLRGAIDDAIGEQRKQQW